MPRHPYMNFPFPFYRNSPGPRPNFQNFQGASIKNNNVPVTNAQITNDISGFEYKEKNNRDFKAKNKSNKYPDDYLFDLFGLKIYSDDVLLVSLIYFLYSEDVKDDGLFLVLILLLLS